MTTFFENLEMADKHATLAINSFGSIFPDWLMPLVSDRLVWVPLYLLLVWILIKRLGWRRALVTLIIAVLAVAACDQFANLIKNWAQRFRPCRDGWMLDNGLRILEKKGSKFGFFSAHAATLTGISVVILASLKKYLPKSEPKSRLPFILGCCLSFWVLLVGASRIFVGKHFLGDVIVGIAAGLLTSWLVFKICDYLVSLQEWEKL